MNKIQKVSSYFLGIFNVLLIGWPLLVLLQWTFVDTSIAKSIMSRASPIQAPEGHVDLVSVHWTPLSQLIGVSAELLGMLPFVLGLYFLKRVFQNYKKGEIFSTLNVSYYRYLGWLFFLNALFAKPIGDMLMILAVTLSNPPGHRYISISFGSPNVGTLFCGAVVIVISWVMLEASKLQDEQTLTI